MDVIDREVKLVRADICKDMTLVELIDEFRQADIVVYEGFWVHPNKAMSGHFNYDEVPAVRVIGSLLTLCELHGVKTIEKQQPSQRVAGYRFAGLVYKKGAKGKHAQDATAHGVYYAVRKLRAVPPAAM